jgi:hypothetical protein
LDPQVWVACYCITWSEKSPAIVHTKLWWGMSLSSQHQSSNEDGSCVIVDDGRGRPTTDIHPMTAVSALETVFTILHAEGKSEN